METDSTFVDIAANTIPAKHPMMSERRIAVALLLGDLLGVFLCLQGSYFFYFGGWLGIFSRSLLGTIIVIILGFYIADNYRPDLHITGLGGPTRTFISCLVIILALSGVSYLFNWKALTPLAWRSILLPGLGLFTVWAVFLRIVASRLARSIEKQSSYLFLGTSDIIQKFRQDYVERYPLGKLIILSNESEAGSKPVGNLRNQPRRFDDRPEWSSYLWSAVVVAPQLELSERIIQQLMHLRLKGTPIYKLPDFYEMFWQKLPSVLLRDTWFAFGDGFNLVTNRANLKLKRLIDLCMACLLLLFLSPIMLATALAIRVESPGPIFYSQLRNGLNGTPFLVYKFRSMYQDAEKQGVQWAKKHDPRITQAGYWLRLVRIDELPQLWNVLKGDMSLIGPRPERPEFDSQLASEIPYYTLRYLVRPGITGWAQVSYPYGASVKDAYEKLSYDLYYIKNYSIWLDLTITFKTIRVVLLGKGR
jgi:exopolysaccharide biosynthesis polyprenyl glycosylphosphotransferase